jgi:hypothetical protein
VAQPEQGIQQFNTTFLLTSFSFGFGRGAVLIGPESAEFAFFATEHFLQQSKKGLSSQSRQNNVELSDFFSRLGGTNGRG